MLTDTVVCSLPDQLTVLQPLQLEARMLTEDSVFATLHHYSDSVHYAVVAIGFGKQSSSSVTGLIT